MDRTKTLIGYACGIGAANPDCADGPATLMHSKQMLTLQAQFEQTLMIEQNSIDSKLAAIPQIKALSLQLAQAVIQSDFFVTLGGDHTSAIGSYSGAASKLDGDLGLIWVDAHLDSHTPETSHSKNPHGMPLATLLGHGDPRLTDIVQPGTKVQPEHLCVIGIRDYEIEERSLLDSLNVRIIYMDEINERSLAACMQEAFDIAQKNTIGFAISIDVDAFDPIDAPGTGAPVANGIRANEMLAVLQQIPHPELLVGIDLTEFNPHLDVGHRTERLILALLETIVNNISR